jgi:nucleoside diphosphate kinase
MGKDPVKREISRVAADLSAARQPADKWIIPLGEHPSAGRNHFVLFLKPELLDAHRGAKIGAILDLIGESLRKYHVHTGAVRALNGPYLARHKIMEEHYGVINRASRLGRAALSPPTRQKLEAECPGVKTILGAHQFLERYPDVSAFALNIIVDTVGSKKIASGKYYSTLTVEGERVVVLNAFHPQQLLHYTQAGQVLVAFECWSDTDWQVLREEMTGATDPRRASQGSIRGRLRERSRELGLPEVTTATNGVHCSAGPLEGMLEYCRFFSDHTHKELIRASATHFGRMLQERGLRQKDITALAKNPLLGEGGAATYAFNQTEDKNSEIAADLLANALRRAA